MTTQEILETLRDGYPECLTADGFDDAILGVVEIPGRPAVACYDYDQCAEILMERDKISRQEAEEYLDFNTVGAIVGKYGPVFLHNWRR